MHVDNPLCSEDGTTRLIKFSMSRSEVADILAGIAERGGNGDLARIILDDYSWLDVEKTRRGVSFTVMCKKSEAWHGSV